MEKKALHETERMLRSYPMLQNKQSRRPCGAVWQPCRQGESGGQKAENGAVRQCCGALRRASFGGQASYSSPSATKLTVGMQKTTPYGGAATVQYNRPAAAKPAVRKREKTPSELGDAVVARMLVDEGIMDPKDLEEYLASFEEPSARTFTAGVGRSDIIGANANANEAAARTQATPEELMLAAAPDLAAAGIDPSVLQAGLSLGNTAKQLWDDTHIAEGMSAPLYLVEKGLSGTAMGLEGAWNGIVDFARAGVNADLAQQAQQAQQFAWLGEPYQRYADSIADTSQAIQEVLPEAAENLRSHKAAEYAQQIDELYQAGGYLKLLGDIVSAGGQTLPTVGINLATGGTMGLPYLFVSAEGNAAAEARAGGADEDLALLYGLSSAGLEVATEKISDGLPGMKGGWIDNWLADYAETDMGRAALKAAKDSVGEGLEEFTSGMVQPYLAKMWNGDERDFWQTLGESTPDGEWRWEIDDSKAQFYPNGDARGATPGTQANVRDYIIHPELDEAEPGLFDMSVQIDPKIEPDSDGLYFGLNGGITLSPSAGKSTMLHELQHGIQDLEGFAGGSNRDWGGKWALVVAYEAAKGEPEFQALATKEARLQYLQNKAIQFAEVDTIEEAAYKFYEMAAGEVEARDVESRAHYDTSARQIIDPDMSGNVLYAENPSSRYIDLMKKIGYTK